MIFDFFFPDTFQTRFWMQRPRRPPPLRRKKRLRATPRLKNRHASTHAYQQPRRQTTVFGDRVTRYLLGIQTKSTKREPCMSVNTVCRTFSGATYRCNEVGMQSACCSDGCCALVNSSSATPNESKIGEILPYIYAFVGFSVMAALFGFCLLRDARGVIIANEEAAVRQCHRPQASPFA